MAYKIKPVEDALRLHAKQHGVERDPTGLLDGSRSLHIHLQTNGPCYRSEPYKEKLLASSTESV
jgi:hypothetical protein